MTVFDQAMANQNHALSNALERMGMSIAESVKHMKDKDKKQVEDPVVMGSHQQPSPLPPPPAPPVRKKSRSRRARPREFIIAAQRAQPPSREDSLASTVRYPTPSLQRHKWLGQLLKKNGTGQGVEEDGLSRFCRLLKKKVCHEDDR